MWSFNDVIAVFRYVFACKKPACVHTLISPPYMFDNAAGNVPDTIFEDDQIKKYDVDNDHEWSETMSDHDNEVC